MVFESLPLYRATIVFAKDFRLEHQVTRDLNGRTEVSIGLFFGPGNLDMRWSPLISTLWASFHFCFQRTLVPSSWRNTRQRLNCVTFLSSSSRFDLDVLRSPRAGADLADDQGCVWEP